MPRAAHPSTTCHAPQTRGTATASAVIAVSVGGYDGLRSTPAIRHCLRGLSMKRLPRTVLAFATIVVAAVAQAAPIGSQGTWQTTLKARNINGEAVALDDTSAAFFYDTTLNITWLRDANAAAGSIYDNTDIFGGSATDGLMTWSNAQAWAGSLTVGAYSDWRLPTMIDTGTVGCDYSLVGDTDCGYNVQTRDAGIGTVYSEIAHLFYVTLGNRGNYLPGTGLPDPLFRGLENTGEFMNFAGSSYWSGLPSPDGVSGAWFFNIGGYQDITGVSNGLSVLAVRDGDVAAVPLPGTVVLALTALAALLPFSRQRRP